MTFSSGSTSKLVYACALAEALSCIVLRQNDAACCGVFDREVTAISPVGRGLSFLDQLSEVLERIEPIAGTDVAAAMTQLLPHMPQRGIAVVISDFLDDPRSITEGLKCLKLAGHEVIALQVLDPRETAFDMTGPIRFEGIEVPSSLLVEPQRVRSAYLGELHRHLHALRDGLGRAGIEYRLTDTRKPIDETLLAYLAVRHKRRRTSR